MSGLEKFKNSMQTIADLRITPFLPVAKINKNSKLYKDFVNNGNILERETSWGKIQIRNRLLTQHHFDVLNGIMTLPGKEMGFISSGQLVVYLSLYQLAKHLGISWGKKTKANLNETISEIEDLKIKRWDKKGNFKTYSIIAESEYVNDTNILKIKFSKEFVKHFQQEITINFAEIHKKMRKMLRGRGEGLVKAIINFFITQRSNQKIGLLQLLKTIGYPTETERQIRNAKEILNVNIELLKEFNIL